MSINRCFDMHEKRQRSSEPHTKKERDDRITHEGFLHEEKNGV